ncbi:MAG: hydroxymethylpyrimidine kinase/phosphomethylpyrimidine kinase/thiamine-phosphate diphosphorylase, partial [Cellvibrionaceae bacterium]
AVDHQVFISQLQAIESLPYKAVKIGLIASLQQVLTIRDFLDKAAVPSVLDTVFSSSSGETFLNDELVQSVRQHLLPRTTLLTPNIHEAAKLVGSQINTTAAIEAAADSILSMGSNAVLIKGGHFPWNNNQPIQDYFTDGKKSFWLASEPVSTAYCRGSGCALASAIASALAINYSLYDALVIGKMAISQGLRHAYGVESEYGPVSIRQFPNSQCDLPVLSHTPLSRLDTKPFADCQPPLLALYPVVNRAGWIKILADAGVTTVQLRVKDLQGETLSKEIEQAVALAKIHRIRLFINDHWRLAIIHRAYGVHLGQEDLDTADTEQIYRAGLRLGISTHCHYEVARAHGYRPSYMACGPVFHTTTKDMPWIPHGIDGLNYWQKLLSYPLVAIGGINGERFASVAATGVDGIAMITAITEAENPGSQARDFVSQFQAHSTHH